MPRLLIVCEYPTLNGGERSLLATFDDVRDAGFEICVACPPTGLLAKTLAERGISISPFSVRDTHGRRHPNDELRATLESIVSQVAPDLLHANSLSMSRLTGPVAAGLGLPSIGHLRDIVGTSAAAIADLNRHARLLAVSRATRDFHVQAGLDPARTHVLHNGVCCREFRPQAASGFLRNELGLAEDALLAASIGQIGMRKGLDVVLQAAEQVLATAPQLHFLIVGQRHSEKAEATEFEEMLHQLAGRPPLRDHVHFLGWRNDVAAILNEIHLLVHAARQEPFGRVLLEAAATGVPVVATDVGGTREVFAAESSESQVSPDGFCGALLVPVDDADALADAIMRVVRSPMLAKRLASATRRQATRYLDIPPMAAKLLRHYQEVLGSA